MTPPTASLRDRLLEESDAFKCGAASTIGMVADPEACVEIAAMLQEAAAAPAVQQQGEAVAWISATALRRLAESRANDPSALTNTGWATAWATDNIRGMVSLFTTPPADKAALLKLVAEMYSRISNSEGAVGVAKVLGWADRIFAIAMGGNRNEY